MYLVSIMVAIAAEDFIPNEVIGINGPRLWFPCQLQVNILATYTHPFEICGENSTCSIPTFDSHGRTFTLYLQIFFFL